MSENSTDTVFQRDQFRKSLEQGKYHRWVLEIDEGGLVKLLLSIHVLVEAVKKAGGLANIDFGHFLSRVRQEETCCALTTIILFVSNDLDEEAIRPNWPGTFKENKPAFRTEVQKKLSAGYHTAWAALLNEEEFSLVSWMVGFYACRNRAIFRDDVETNKIVYGLTLLSQAYAEIRGFNGKFGKLLWRKKQLKWPE